VIKLNNEQINDQITLLYFEQIPWYFRVFLHTLKITTLDDLQTEIKPGKNRNHFFVFRLIIVRIVMFV